MVTAEELVVAIKSDGVSETREDLEGVEQSMEETADSAGDAAEDLEGFSQRFRGAMAAAVAALAVGAAGLLSQVPVLGELFAGLSAIVQAVSFQMDGVLRPALTDLTTTLFEIANAINEADGSMGSLIGTLATVGAGTGLVIGALVALGVTLTGPLLAAIALVAGAIAALWRAWQTNFANIRGVVMGLLDTITTRFESFVSTVGPIISSFLASLSDFWDTHGDTIVSIVNFAFRVISATIAAAVDTILTVIQVTLQILSGDWSGAWDSITNYFARTVDRWGPLLSEAVGVIMDLMTGLAEDLKTWAGDRADDAYEWGVGIVEGLIDGIRSVIGRLKEQLEELADIAPGVSVDMPNIGGGAGGGGGTGGGGGGIVGTAATVGRTLTGGSGDGGTYLDGRNLTESTGRYRSDGSRRQGL